MGACKKSESLGAIQAALFVVKPEGSFCRFKDKLAPGIVNMRSFGPKYLPPTGNPGPTTEAPLSNFSTDSSDSSGLWLEESAEKVGNGSSVVGPGLPIGGSSFGPKDFL